MINFLKSLFDFSYDTRDRRPIEQVVYKGGPSFWPDDYETYWGD